MRSKVVEKSVKTLLLTDLSDLAISMIAWRRTIRRHTRQPAYNLHKTSGRAYVQLCGKQIYLGKHGTPESKAAYDSLIATWLANGRQLPNPDSKLVLCHSLIVG